MEAERVWEEERGRKIREIRETGSEGGKRGKKRKERQEETDMGGPHREKENRGDRG